MPFLGTSDHHIWKIWSYAGATHPLGEIYRVQGDVRLPLTPAYIKRTLTGLTKPAKWLYQDRADYVEYPPVTPILFGVMGRIYQIFSPGFENTHWLNALVKVPALIADMLATTLVYLFACRYYSRRFGLRAAAVYWLNPLSIFAGPLLAYQDPLYAAWLGAAVLCFSLCRHAWGYVLYVGALLTKPQPVLVLPALAFASFGRRSFPRLVGYVASGAGALTVALLPFLLSGTLLNLLANNLRNTQERYLSAYNSNIWWIASYARDVQRLVRHGASLTTAGHVSTQITYMPHLLKAGLPDPKPLGVVLFLLFATVIMIIWWARFGDSIEAKEGGSPALAETVAFLIYGATMLLTQVHENHAYGAVALLGFAWWLNGARNGKADRELLAIYSALSVVVFLNIFLFYGFGEELGERIVPRDIFYLDLSVVNSLLNLVVFGWWLWRWIRPLPLFNKRHGLAVAAVEPSADTETAADSAGNEDIERLSA